MLIKLLLLFILLALLFSGMNKIKRLPPKQRKDTIFKIVIGGIIAVVLLGLVTGRMHWLGAVIAAMIPLFRFGLGTAMRILPMWLSRSGGNAQFKTEHLDVQVAVQQGRVRGEVIKGLYAGQRIEDLSDEQLAELEEQYRERDKKSYYIIRVARHRSGSADHESTPPPSFADPAHEEALQILGLTGEPTRDQVIGAHRRLINKIHPDRGGSDFLAARVNQAKDVLLKRIRDR